MKAIVQHESSGNFWKMPKNEEQQPQDWKSPCVVTHVKKLLVTNDTLGLYKVGDIACQSRPVIQQSVPQLTGNHFDGLMAWKQMSMLNDVIRLFASGNQTNTANTPKSTGAAPHSSWYLGIQEKAGVYQMSASATNHQP